MATTEVRETKPPAPAPQTPGPALPVASNPASWLQVWLPIWRLPCCAHMKKRTDWCWSSNCMTNTWPWVWAHSTLGMMSKRCSLPPPPPTPPPPPPPPRLMMSLLYKLHSLCCDSCECHISSSLWAISVNKTLESRAFLHVCCCYLPDSVCMVACVHAVNAMSVHTVVSVLVDIAAVDPLLLIP